jgi:hypothetical protein
MSTVRSNNKAAHFALAAIGLGALAFASVACERDQQALGVDRDKEPTTAPGERPKTTAGDKNGDKAGDQAPHATGAFASALDSIASARCDREAKCKNIGADQKFKSKDACLAEVKKDKVEGLNASECPGGIDQKELGECLEEIRNEDCNNPLDTIGRLAACRTSDMCKATTAPNR